METIDLDARRAEAGVISRTVRFAGRDWQVPSRVPFAVTDMFADMVDSNGNVITDADTGRGMVMLGKFRNAVRALFGEQTDDVIAAGLAPEDFMVLLEGLGAGLGESEPSAAPSNGNGTRSNATSNGSTGSTSRKPVGAAAKRKTTKASG